VTILLTIWSQAGISVLFVNRKVEPLLQGPEKKIEAYRSFLVNVKQFQTIGILPTNVYFYEITASFTVHSASWHKSCQ